jgi:hypothetical protein
MRLSFHFGSDGRREGMSRETFNLSDFSWEDFPNWHDLHYRSSVHTGTGWIQARVYRVEQAFRTLRKRRVNITPATPRFLALDFGPCCAGRTVTVLGEFGSLDEAKAEVVHYFEAFGRAAQLKYLAGGKG